MLEAVDISVSYAQRKVLEGISLRAEPGVLTALVGPNGAGKSTLMRALNGMVPVDAGKVLLDHRPIGEWSRRAIAVRVAVAAQEGDFRFPVTVMEFVLGGRYASATISPMGWETEHDVEIARTALEETAMTVHASRMMNELSGGERQSAVIARALATQAGILLLDEPTANLDLAHQANMLSLVSERCKRFGNAAVVVTHDLNLAAEFADSIVLLKQGRMIVAGAPSDVFAEELLGRVFDIRVVVDRHPVSGAPRVTPVHNVNR